MTAGRLNIVQVSSWLREGGAERVALNLHRAFRAAGHEATLVVGGLSGADPDGPIDEPGAVRLPNYDPAFRGAWTRAWWAVERGLKRCGGPVARTAARAANRLAEPMRAVDRAIGREEFRFPGARRLLNLCPGGPPDVVHCHNLHGGYFDLRMLPWLGERVPVVLTLHDPWLLTGHCAYPFECGRWATGCGRCPHLDTYPQLRRDHTAANWRGKARIYEGAQLRVAAPSRWLIDMVSRSMLAPAVSEARVIPYGVDLGVFRPVGNERKRQLRNDLGLPQAARVLLYAANRLRQNPFKDFATLEAAVGGVADGLGTVAARGEAGSGNSSAAGGPSVIFVALGADGASRRVGPVEIRYVPYRPDPNFVANYYQSADVFLHAARADNFPNTVLEALACGVPVVATAVGGIPEQVRPAGDEATGRLVPPADPAAMARAVLELLADEPLRRRLAGNAERDARRRFDLRGQCETYLRWFGQIAGRALEPIEPAEPIVACAGAAG